MFILGLKNVYQLLFVRVKCTCNPMSFTCSSALFKPLFFCRTRLVFFFFCRIYSKTKTTLEFIEYCSFICQVLNRFSNILSTFISFPKKCYTLFLWIYVNLKPRSYPLKRRHVLDIEYLTNENKTRGLQKQVKTLTVS